MKVRPLDYGVQIETNLTFSSQAELIDILNLVIQERLVVMKNQDITVERFNEINELWGIHQPANIWASDKNFPNIIRVTNKEVEKGKKGLFHGQELNWHCNGVFAPDPEQCVGLWCMETGVGGATYFNCGIHAYEQLDNETKEAIEDATITVTNNIKQTVYQKSAYSMLAPYEQVDLDKMSTRNRNFAGGDDGNPYDHEITLVDTARKDLPSGKKRKKEATKKLVMTHPKSGAVGLHFPFMAVSSINDVKFEKDWKSIFHKLVELSVGPSAKIYKHNWEKGDFVVSDQILSLHRRDPYSGIRELYRTAFWYR